MFLDVENEEANRRDTGKRMAKRFLTAASFGCR